MKAHHRTTAKFALLICSLLLAQFSFTGCFGKKSKAASVSEIAATTVYTCPMHPQIIKHAPGSCSICGMDLVLKKQRQSASATDKAFLTIDPTVVQKMGVRTATAQVGSINKAIRAFGNVEVAEDRVFVVNLRYSGWVEKLLVAKTGSHVKKGEVLFTIYSPELISAQEEYILSLKSNRSLVKSAKDRLLYFGLSPEALQRLKRTRKIDRLVNVRARQSGYVLAKNIVDGTRVKAGDDLYRIGDLTRVWVNTELYEFDAPWVKVGAPALMELSFEKGKKYRGKVAYIYPTLNPRTRTLKVRLEFDNKDAQIKPGMLATIRIESQAKNNVIKIPTEAIIHSGSRQIVFVTNGNGKFESRQIVAGLAGDGHVTEVVKGLLAGEEVVVSGQFMLDSESQLQEAIQKMTSGKKPHRHPGLDPGSHPKGEK